MRTTFLFICLLFIGVKSMNAQVFTLDTIQYAGDPDKYINLVILGDGYTAAEQDSFIADAKAMSAYWLGQEPWQSYATYFNVIAIEVISKESGVKHPNTAGDCSSASPAVPVSDPDNYFGSTFDDYGIHRLVVAKKIASVASVLADNFPNYDQVLILANTTYYGGSGGAYPVSTTGTSSFEITAHEVGHSFANLADEYYAGDVYAQEMPNMTKETDSTQVKWANWVGDFNIGIFQHCCGGNSAQWYRPHENCKMRYLGTGFCSVCSQAIIESIHELVNPLVSYEPQNTTISSQDQFIPFKLNELMQPSPNTLRTEWLLDSVVISTNVDSIEIDQSQLANGLHTVSVNVTDTNAMLRVNNHALVHVSSVSWNIQKIITGIEIQASENEISYSVYPNPATDVLKVSLNLANTARTSLSISNADGKIIRSLAIENLGAGSHFNDIDVQNLPAGIYFLSIRSDAAIMTKTFIKE